MCAGYPRSCPPALPYCRLPPSDPNAACGDSVDRTDDRHLKKAPGLNQRDIFEAGHHIGIMISIGRQQIQRQRLGDAPVGKGLDSGRHRDGDI